MLNKIITACFAAALLPGAAMAQYYFDGEGGLVTASHNSVRIPLEGGTQFSLSDELKSETEPYARMRVGRRFGKNDISFLAAPLTMRSEGRLHRNVVFTGVTFPAGVPAKAVYRFNSYRVKYLYEFHRGEDLVMRWGGALKLRHAGIKLTAGGVTAESKDTGFVPLAAFSLEYAFRPGWLLLCDVEALGAPQGRAEDVMVAVSREASPGMRMRVGYRMLEGGAGGGDVYTFAWLHYFLAGVSYQF